MKQYAELDMHGLINFFKCFRLQNYGYDYKDFRQMSAQKARIWARLRQVDPADWAASPRLQRMLAYHERLQLGAHGWRYTTGQSQNEEMINLAARILEVVGLENK